MYINDLAMSFLFHFYFPILPTTALHDLSPTHTKMATWTNQSRKEGNYNSIDAILWASNDIISDLPWNYCCSWLNFSKREWNLQTTCLRIVTLENLTWWEAPWPAGLMSTSRMMWAWQGWWWQWGRIRIRLQDSCWNSPQWIWIALTNCGPLLFIMQCFRAMWRECNFFWQTVVSPP